MYYSSIFQQLFNFIPRHRFEKSAENLSGDRYCKHFTAWRQFLTCLYAQITGKDSLREIENGPLVNHDRLYHLGMEVVSKSTLSEAMNRRDPEIFKALFEEILDRALKCAPRHKFRFHNPPIPAWIQTQPHGIDESNPRNAYAESFPARNPRIEPQDHYEAANLEFSRAT